MGFTRLWAKLACLGLGLELVVGEGFHDRDGLGTLLLDFGGRGSYAMLRYIEMPSKEITTVAMTVVTPTLALMPSSPHPLLANF